MGKSIHQFFWHQTEQAQAIYALIVGLFVSAAVRHWHIWEVALISGWITTNVVYLIAQRFVIVGANGLRTQRRASQYGPSGWILLMIAILIALLGTALLGVLLTEVGHRKSYEARLLIGLSVAAVLLSWLVLHLTFGKQYARFYISVIWL